MASDGDRNAGVEDFAGIVIVLMLAMAIVFVLSIGVGATAEAFVQRPCSTLLFSYANGP